VVVSRAFTVFVLSLFGFTDEKSPVKPPSISLSTTGGNVSLTSQPSEGTSGSKQDSTASPPPETIVKGRK